MRWSRGVVPVVAVAVAVAVAVGLGVVASLSDRWGSGYPPQQGWRAIGLLGDRGDVGFSGLTGVLRLWLTAAVVVGVPAAVLLEVVVRFRPSLQEFDFDPVRAWTLVVMVGLGALAGLGVLLQGVRVGPRARLPRPRSRSVAR